MAGVSSASPRECLRNPLYAAREVGLSVSFGSSMLSCDSRFDEVKGLPRQKEALSVLVRSINAGVDVQMRNPNQPFRSYYTLELGMMLPGALRARKITGEQITALINDPDYEKPAEFLKSLRALKKYYYNPIMDFLPPRLLGWTRSDIDSFMNAKFGKLFADAFQPNIYMRFGRSPVKASLDLAHFVAQRKLESDGRTMHLFHRSMEVMLRVRTARDAGYNDRRLTYLFDFRALTPSYIAVSHIDQREVDDFFDLTDSTCSYNFLTKTAALHIKDEPKRPPAPDVFPVPGSGYIR